MPATVKGTYQGNGLYLTIMVPRLDATNVGYFKHRVELLWDHTPENLVINMKRVGFIDSMGIGAILGLYKRLPHPETHVKLTHVQPQIQTILEILRLHRIFRITPMSSSSP